MMGPENRPSNLNQAFNAALILDQVSLFNQVVQEAIINNALENPSFTSFLEYCIQKQEEVKKDEKNAPDVAKDKSKELATAASRWILQIQCSHDARSSITQFKKDLNQLQPEESITHPKKIL
jgi:hypothetical protein